MRNHTFNIVLAALALITLPSCFNKNKSFDATGTFEATEIIVSAEANGKILKFDPEEGALLKAGQEVVFIDPSNLELQKVQAQSSIQAINQKQNDPRPQIQVLQRQLQSAEAQIATLQAQMAVLSKEQKRIQAMYNAEAATGQNLDDFNGKVDILSKQIAAAQEQKSVINAQIQAAKETVSIQNKGITSEIDPMKKKIAILDDQLQKTTAVNPIDGNMITKYANAGELVAMGKPLYKLANMDEMTLRAYVTGDQLPTIKTNDKVQVYIDDADGKYKQYEGTITWISPEAEFTPKTIQTKNERSNLVYAIKIKVKNDGYLKIGMYGEVTFEKAAAAK